MILSYRDARTARFVRGERVKQFEPPKEITVPIAKVLAVHRVIDGDGIIGRLTA